MEKMTKNFYLKRIEYLEKELKEKEEKFNLYNKCITYLVDTIDKAIEYIKNSYFYSAPEFYDECVNLLNILEGKEND